MEQGRFREAVGHGACREIFRLFMEFVSGHYPKRLNSGHTHTLYSFNPLKYKTNLQYSMCKD